MNKVLFCIVFMQASMTLASIELSIPFDSTLKQRCLRTDGQISTDGKAAFLDPYVTQDGNHLSFGCMYYTDLSEFVSTTHPKISFIKGIEDQVVLMMPATFPGSTSPKQCIVKTKPVGGWVEVDVTVELDEIRSVGNARRDANDCFDWASGLAVKIESN